MLSNDVSMYMVDFKNNLAVIESSKNIILVADIYNVYSVEFYENINKFSKQFINRYLEVTDKDTYLYRVVNLLICYKMKKLEKLYYISDNELKALACIGYIFSNYPPHVYEDSMDYICTPKSKLYELYNDYFKITTEWLLKHFMEITTVLFSDDLVDSNLLYKELIGKFNALLKDEFINCFDPFDKLLTKEINNFIIEVEQDNNETHLF